MLSNFQWYRKWRGGRWAAVTGYMWGKRWVRVTPECVERVDEDWRAKRGGDDANNDTTPR